MIFRNCSRYDCAHCKRPSEGVRGGCTFGPPFDSNESVDECKDYHKVKKYERKIYATDKQIVLEALRALERHDPIIDNGMFIYEALLRFKERLEKEK